MLFLAVALCASVVMFRAQVESRTLAVLGSLAILLPVLTAFLTWSPSQPTLAEVQTPQKIDDQGYVSSEACRACHAAEYESWYGSYHRTMTQVASPESIVAPHEATALSANGRTFKVDFEADVMWSEDVHPYAMLDRLAETVKVLPGPNFVSAAERTLPANIKKLRSQIVMTTGSHHMQMYWLRDPKGAFRHLSWVWLIRDQRWVPSESVYLQPPEGVMGMAGQWETNCIKCHAIGGQPHINGPPSRIAPRESKVGELGIACEGCHGPAKDHIEANRNPLRRYALHLSREDDESIVHPNKITSKQASEICGRCHSGHNQLAWDKRIGTPFKPGDSLEKYFRLRHYDTQPEDERTGYFWRDGTARVTGREYSAMIESACYTRGDLGCNSCHSMHDSEPDDQLASDRQSNNACLQCHPSYRDKIAEHTHHPEGSSGARCYNCHMPNTTYGLLSMTRSHRIDNPSVEMSARDGRPNACNLCHVDKTLEWAGEYLSAWYGHDEPSLTRDEENIPAAAIWLLKGDAAQRAAAAWHMGWDPALDRPDSGWQAPLLARTLSDPYAAVRYLTERSLRKFPGYEDLSYDFVTAGKNQSAAVEASLEIADQATKQSSRRLTEDVIDRLHKERDDTPISFQE